MTKKETQLKVVDIVKTGSITKPTTKYKCEYLDGTQTLIGIKSLLVLVIEDITEKQEYSSKKMDMVNVKKKVQIPVKYSRINKAMRLFDEQESGTLQNVNFTITTLPNGVKVAKV